MHWKWTWKLEITAWASIHMWKTTKEPKPQIKQRNQRFGNFSMFIILTYYNRCVLLLMVITDGINHDSHQMRHTSFQCSCIWNGIIEGYHHKAVAAQWDFWTQFFSDTIFPRKVSSAYSVRFCRNYITLIRYLTNNSCFKHYLQKYGIQIWYGTLTGLSICPQEFQWSQ